MTKEEYKKTIIRMWDSVRNDKYKGRDFCAGIQCLKCPLTTVCRCEVLNYYNTIEFVEEWAKEHPIETNGSEFLKTYPNAEVFSYDTNDNGYVHIRLDTSKPLDAHSNCINIPIRWWESEVDDND